MVVGEAWKYAINNLNFSDGKTLCGLEETEPLPSERLCVKERSWDPAASPAAEIMGPRSDLVLQLCSPD